MRRSKPRRSTSAIASSARRSTARVSFYQIDVGNLIEVANQTGIIFDHPGQADLGGLHLAGSRVGRRSRRRVRKGRCRSRLSTAGQDRLLATGTLLTPNNTIDTTTGTISLKATFENKDDHLWPGQFVNARVQVGHAAASGDESRAGDPARAGRAVRLYGQAGPARSNRRTSRSAMQDDGDAWSPRDCGQRRSWCPASRGWRPGTRVRDRCIKSAPSPARTGAPS